MTRIVRRTLVRDSSGCPLSVQSERVTDDGSGSIHQTSERTAQGCSGCRRPVTELSELRGVCDHCRCRECCVHCLSQCQVCARRLCGHCRQGFAGPPSLTVCATCQRKLLHRQLLQDQQISFEQAVARYRLLQHNQHATFEQAFSRHRLFQQHQALRLNFERTYLTAQLHAARMGLTLNLRPRRQRLLMRAIQKLSRMPATVVRYAWHTLFGDSQRRRVSARR